MGGEVQIPCTPSVHHLVGERVGWMGALAYTGTSFESMLSTPLCTLQIILFALRALSRLFSHLASGATRFLDTCLSFA